jgi:hypothetical protein
LTGDFAVAAFIVPTKTAGYDVLVHDVLDATEEDVVLGNIEGSPFDIDANEARERFVDRKIPLRHVHPG